jgi:tripartite-type tricarboxylate transporter receptor subunit TctC
MKYLRSSILIALVAVAATASAQVPPYPSKPIKMIVPFAPGGGSDTFARLIAQKLNEKRGYSIIVDNKPGAGGNLGAESALREAPDGYTLLVISGSYAGNAVLNKPAFDPMGAIEPVVQFTREPIVLVASAESKYKSLADLVAAAKAKPESIAYGTSGVGGLAHLASEYFASVAGIKMTHIPYKGTSAALVDLSGGQIQMMLSGSSSVSALVKGGKARALAVAAPQRLPSMPDVPTFAEQGVKNFRADLWHGLVVKKGTPKAIVDKLNADINAVLRSPELVEKFAEVDVAPAGGTPAQFRNVIQSDMARWKTIVHQANITIN